MASVDDARLTKSLIDPQLDNQFNQDPTLFMRSLLAGGDSKQLIANLDQTKGNQIDFIKPLDQNIGELVVQYSVFDQLFNPLHYEYLLSSGIELLERCIAYRTFAQDLEARFRSQTIDLVRRKVDAEQLDDRMAMLKIQRDILVKRQEHAQSRIIEIGKKLTEFKSSATGNNPEYQRFEWDLEAESAKFALEADLVGKELQGVSLAISSLETQAAVERRFYDAYAIYADETGNALKYKERIERVRSMFDNDVEQAFRRLHIASVGIQSRWPDQKLSTGDKTDYSFPDAKKDGYLDQLLNWARRQSYWFDVLSEKESSFTVAVSFRYLLQSTSQGDTPINKDPFATLVSGQVVTFKLDPNWFFPSSRNVRLKGLRAGVVLRSEVTDPSLVATKWQLTLVPPPQKVGSNTIVLPKVVLGSVGVISAEDNSSPFEGESLNNADPFVGEWHISMLLRAGKLDFTDAVDQTNADTIRDTRYFSDLILEWNVVAELT